MSKRKRTSLFWKKLNNPANWIVFFVYLFTLTLCPLAVISMVKDSDLGYSIYAVIGYVICGMLLVYTICMIVIGCVGVRKGLKNVKDKPRFTRQLRNDFFHNAEFRSLVFTGCSLLFNVGYTLFLCVMAIRLLSSWYGSLAIYYILLTLTRGGMLIQTAKDAETHKDDLYALHLANVGTYMYCGVMMIALAAAFSVSVVQVVAVGAGYRVPIWGIWTFAGFAICRLGVAIFNFVKASKYDDLAARSAKYINLTTALVSLLSLQTAFMTVFSSSLNQSIVNGLMGAVVFFVILTLGIYMVAHAGKKYKKLKEWRKKTSENADWSGYNRDGYREEYDDRGGNSTL